MNKSHIPVTSSLQTTVISLVSVLPGRFRHPGPNCLVFFGIFDALQSITTIWETAAVLFFSIFSTPHVNSIKQPRWCTLTITQQLSPLPCLIYEEKFGAVQIYKGCYSLDGNISCTLAHRTAQDIHLLGTCSKLFFTYHPAATSIKHCKIAFLKVCTMFDFGINSAE